MNYLLKCSSASVVFSISILANSFPVNAQVNSNKIREKNSSVNALTNEQTLLAEIPAGIPTAPAIPNIANNPDGTQPKEIEIIREQPTNGNTAPSPEAPGGLLAPPEPASSQLNDQVVMPDRSPTRQTVQQTTVQGSPTPTSTIPVTTFQSNTEELPVVQTGPLDLIPRSYVGVGPTLAGTRIGGPPARVGVQFAGRYKLDFSPFSLRATGLFGTGQNGSSAAIVPTVSVDVPLGDRTNVYLGFGASFITDTTQESMLGDKDAFALQPGFEISLDRNFLIYGNAIVAVDGYKNGQGTALAIQAGVGLQF